jgi:two-component system sensor histidine kinase BaeS
VKRINTLVNDLYELSLSDLGAMKYQMVETDIKNNIESSIESFRDRYREAEIDIKTNFDEVGNILGDQHRLTQLFTNLLENTLKYTDGPGSLNINMQGIDNEIIVSFADSAPGVDEETLDKIFDRFYRVELSRSREMGGAGLGLSICSEIVDAHSGSIKAKQSSIGGLEIVIIFNKAES